jgi:predicted metalloprotease with PDZ domain
LCSHEYFHLWNVKRIQPQALEESALDREAYTEDLWAYEGVTSYYDELALMRAGLLDLNGYCELIAEAATRLWRTPGRLKQSLAESSFDAWTKFYRPDENTPNAVVSYYNKGALVALCLDLTLRLESQGRCDLDQVMRLLWQRHGLTGVPAPEHALETLALEISGMDLRDFFERMVRGTDDPPLAELLQAFGIDAQLRHMPGDSQRAGVSHGLRLQAGGPLPQVQHVLDDSPAQAAGLAAGDLLVALDGLRAEGQDVDRLLVAHAPGDRVRVHAFRRDELMEFELTLAPASPDTWLMRPQANADAAALARRKAWLRQ